MGNMDLIQATPARRNQLGNHYCHRWEEKVGPLLVKVCLPDGNNQQPPDPQETRESENGYNQVYGSYSYTTKDQSGSQTVKVQSTAQSLHT